jgi:hypothetical protein
MSLRRSVVLGFAGALLLGGCASKVEIGNSAIAGKTPDAYVTMRMVQAAYMGSGTVGHGTVSMNGNTYAFRVDGLGVGGIGVSEIEAAGEAYSMPSISLFPGPYAQARYGFALGTASGGDLWLQNDAGVILHLKAKREGLMLSLGGDAIKISME